MSTVSGGGYIGSTLSAILNTSKINLRETFPILHKWGEQENGVFRHLRNGANYLHPGEALEKLRIPSLIFVGVLSNLLLVAPYILFAAALAYFPYLPQDAEGLPFYERIHSHSGYQLEWTWSKWAWASVLVLFFFLPRTQHAKFWSWLARGLTAGRRRLKRGAGPSVGVLQSRLLGRSLYERVFGILVITACLVTFVEAQPALLHLLVDEDDSPEVWLWSFAALAGLTVILLLVVAASFAKASSPRAGRTALYGFGVVGPLLLWLIYAGLCIWDPFATKRIEDLTTWFNGLDLPARLVLAGDAVFVWLESLGRYRESVLFFLTGLLALALGKVLVDVNDSSLNSVYRNRLSRGFLFYVDADGRTVQDLQYDALPPADELKLSDLNQPGASAPYHLLNATLNLQRSEVRTARNRKADFFFFSKEYTGGPLTGYCRTKNLEKIDPGLDLGTAMAISGAAASANMGSGTVGALVFFLALLNVRLGYWLVNPKVVRKRGELPSWRVLRRWSLPRVGPIHFLRELFGRLDAKGQNVYLSDGGHLENLGVFELLRRRCRYIIVCDAERDSAMRFGGLARLIRLARVDLGCNIDIELDDLRPKDGVSSRHCALGRIDYGKGEFGELLYIKLSVTGDESETIREYREQHPAFPHEPTSDQFFTEAQFEAYRHLGWHITKRLVERATGSRQVVDKEAGAGMREFFGSLKSTLRARVERPSSELALHSELSAIEARFSDSEIGAYSYEVYPELGLVAEPPPDTLTPESHRQIFHLCNQQILLMERIFLSCHLDDPMRRKESRNEGWVLLFRRWARVPIFQCYWALGLGRQDTAFRRFCQEELGIRPEITWYPREPVAGIADIVGIAEKPCTRTAMLSVASAEGSPTYFPVGYVEWANGDAQENGEDSTADGRLIVDDRYYRPEFVARLLREAKRSLSSDVRLAKPQPLDLCALPRPTSGGALGAELATE